MSPSSQRTTAIGDEDPGASDPAIWGRELGARLEGFRAIAAREGGAYGRWASDQAAIIVAEIGNLKTVGVK